MLLAAQGAPGGITAVWVEAGPELRCPEQGAVLGALRARLGESRVGHGRGVGTDFTLRLHRRGARGMTVVLRRSGVLLVERTIEVHENECASLAETLALLVDTWVTVPEATARRRPAERRAAEPAPAVARAALGAPVVEASPAPVAPEDALSGTVANPREAGGDRAPSAAPAPPSPAVPPAALVMAQPAPVEVAVVAPPAPAPSPSGGWAATLAADGGALVAFDGGARTTAAGRVDFSVAYRGWQLGVRAAVESAADVDDSAAALRIRHVPCGAYFGRRLAGAERARVSLLLGGGVDFISATASGYGPLDRSFDAVDPFATAGLRGEWLLGRRFGVIGGGDLLLALRREQFSVANAGPVAHTSRLRAGLSLGVAWHLQ